jgi:hypothetical protein
MYDADTSLYEAAVSNAGARYGGGKVRDDASALRGSL